MVIGTQCKVYFCVKCGSHLYLPCDANFSSNIMRELNKIQWVLILVSGSWYIREIPFHGYSSRDSKYMFFRNSRKTLQVIFNKGLEISWVLVASTLLLFPDDGFPRGPHEGISGIKSLLLQFGEPCSYWLFCNIVFGHGYLYILYDIDFSFPFWCPATQLRK